MTHLRPFDKVKAWARTTASERFIQCASMLWHHGFLTDTERVKVHIRLRKWTRDQKNGLCDCGGTKWSEMVEGVPHCPRCQKPKR